MSSYEAIVTDCSSSQHHLYSSAVSEKSKLRMASRETAPSSLRNPLFNLSLALLQTYSAQTPPGCTREKNPELLSLCKATNSTCTLGTTVSDYLRSFVDLVIAIIMTLFVVLCSNCFEECMYFCSSPFA